MATMSAPTPAELAADQAPGIRAANLVVAIMATIAVALRLYARYNQKAGIGADDITIVIALPFGWGMCISTWIATEHGLGKHINTLLPEQLIHEGQAYLASELIWAITIPLLKISILLLYLRIFGRLRYIRNLCYSIGVFSVCWAIMVFLVCSLQCRPIQFIWDKSVNGTCLNAWLFFVIGSALNVLTDFAILLLPLPAVWSLKLSNFQKISLIGIFMLGSTTCIFSLVRLISIIRDSNNMDVTWALGIVSIWSTAEPCLGIVAACLPTLRPLFTKRFSIGLNVRSEEKTGSKKSTASHSIGSSGSRNDSGFQKLNGSDFDTRAVTYISSGEANGNSKRVGDLPIPLDAIAVGTTWSVHGRSY